MSIRNLEHFFCPQSVAVIGASEKRHSVGATVLRNILEGGFAGQVMPVNPQHDVLAGIKVYPTVASLPAAPELAIICTPPATVPALFSRTPGCAIGFGANSGSRPPSRRASSCSRSVTTPPRASRRAPASPVWLERLPLPPPPAGRPGRPSRSHPGCGSRRLPGSSDALGRCRRCASFGRRSAPEAARASRS